MRHSHRTHVEGRSVSSNPHRGECKVVSHTHAQDCQLVPGPVTPDPQPTG